MARRRERRASPPLKVALDSCCIIAAFDGEDVGPVVDEVIACARQGTVKLYVSTMVLVEVRGEGQYADPPDTSDTLARLQLPHWNYVELDSLVAEQARELALTHDLKAPDAIHLASAIVADVDVLMTLDRKDFKVGQSIAGVRIELPYYPYGDPLFGADDGQA